MYGWLWAGRNHEHETFLASVLPGFKRQAGSTVSDRAEPPEPHVSTDLRNVPPPRPPPLICDLRHQLYVSQAVGATAKTALQKDLTISRAVVTKLRQEAENAKAAVARQKKELTASRHQVRQISAAKKDLREMLAQEKVASESQAKILLDAQNALSETKRFYSEKTKTADRSSSEKLERLTTHVDMLRVVLAENKRAQAEETETFEATVAKLMSLKEDAIKKLSAALIAQSHARDTIENLRTENTTTAEALVIIRNEHVDTACLFKCLTQEVYRLRQFESMVPGMQDEIYNLRGSDSIAQLFHAQEHIRHLQCQIQCQIHPAEVTPHEVLANFTEEVTALKSVLAQQSEATKKMMADHTAKYLEQERVHAIAILAFSKQTQELTSRLDMHLQIP
jgi:hypothetical protein